MSSASQMQRPRLTRPVSVAQVREIVAGLDTELDVMKLEDDTRFVDAGADSLDFFNIIAGIQEAGALTIPNADIEQVATIRGLAEYLNHKLP
jgi:acyl carrier protein